MLFINNLAVRENNLVKYRISQVREKYSPKIKAHPPYVRKRNLQFVFLIKFVPYQRICLIQFRTKDLVTSILLNWCLTRIERGPADFLFIYFKITLWTIYRPL